MDPVVLVFSEGSKTPLDVISSILEANGVAKDEIKPIQQENIIDVPTYHCNLKTKYYANTLQLIPMEIKLNAVPYNVRELTEAIIIYFNADNKSFLNDLPGICNWLTERNIELGILLTESFTDTDNKCITKADLHKVCSASKFIFDVIELADAHEDEDEDDESERKHDYHEVLTSLKSNIWSNVECKPPSTSSAGPEVSANDETIEGQLEAYTNLLSSIQNFQRISDSLTRDQVHDQAEKLAQILCNTIMDGDDISDDSDSNENDSTDSQRENSKEK